MNWMQRLRAMNSLGECAIHMRKDTSWYILQSVDIKDKSVLKSVCGNGDGPEEAVDDHWKQLTQLESHQYIVAREYREGNLSKRTAVRWNGFMWEHVDEPTRQTEVAA